MRKIAICVLAAFLASCTTYPEIGSVVIKTNASGKIASIDMEKSTGIPKLDHRLVQDVRSTFPTRVPHPLPNHVYHQALTGNMKVIRPYGPSYGVEMVRAPKS